MQVCGRADPSLFAFSLPDCVKTPLCSDDVQSFLSSNSSQQVLISISAYPFVNTLSEGQSHFEHYERLTKGLTFADTLLTRARQNAEELSDSLESLKKSTLTLIEEQFDQMTIRLLDFHSNIERVLEEAKVSIDQGRLTRSVILSDVAQGLVNCADMDKGSNVYDGCLQDCTAEVKRMVEQTLQFPVEDAGGYILIAIRGEDMRQPEADMTGVKPTFQPGVTQFAPQAPLSPAIRALNPYKQNGPTRGYPVPDPYRPPKPFSPQPFSSYRSAYKNCELCRTPLGAMNSIIAPSHEGCFFCFSCLKDYTHTYIRCPVCKTGFNTTIRKSLEARIPGLIKVQSKKRLRRMGVGMGMDYNMTCSECNSHDLFHAHKCPNGDLVCLACCQCSLIMNPQPKPGRCHRCGLSFGGDVYNRFNAKQNQCEGCGSGVTLDDTAEYVRDRHGIRYFCVTCKERRNAPEYPLE